MCCTKRLFRKKKSFKPEGLFTMPARAWPRPLNKSHCDLCRHNNGHGAHPASGILRFIARLSTEERSQRLETRRCLEVKYSCMSDSVQVGGGKTGCHQQFKFSKNDVEFHCCFVSEFHIG